MKPPRRLASALIVGCRLDLTDGATLLVYPTDRPAYSRLCRLLTLGKSRAGKGACDLAWDDVAALAEGLIAVLVPDMPDEACAGCGCAGCATIFGDRAYLALTLRRRPRDHLRLHELSDARRAGARADGRDQRCAVPRARPPHPAGRGHLHPRTAAPSTTPGSGASAMPTAI